MSGLPSRDEEGAECLRDLQLVGASSETTRSNLI